jgi:hypothetical protein
MRGVCQRWNIPLQVRGTVRDPSRKEKVAHLTALADALPGTLTLYAADLLQTGSFDEAIRCASQANHMHAVLAGWSRLRVHSVACQPCCLL